MKFYLLVDAGSKTGTVHGITTDPVKCAAWEELLSYQGKNVTKLILERDEVKDLFNILEELLREPI